MIQLRQVGVRVRDYINKIPQQAQHGGFHHRAVGKSQMSNKFPFQFLPNLFKMEINSSTYFIADTRHNHYVRIPHRLVDMEVIRPNHRLHNHPTQVVVVLYGL
jgi:hypothetical protein